MTFSEIIIKLLFLNLARKVWSNPMHINKHYGADSLLKTSNLFLAIAFKM